MSERIGEKDTMPLADELKEKRSRLKSFLKKEGLDAVILSGQGNFAWYTGGRSNRVVMCDEAGAALIFATGNKGKDFILTSNIEQPRINDEELQGLDGFVLEGFPWWEGEAVPKRITALSKSKKVASDSPSWSKKLLPGSFQELTYSLTEPEVQRYRSLGGECSIAIEDAVKGLKPGMTEEDASARMAAQLLKRGITPQVLLVAADERIYKYRHPIPTPRPIDSYVMCVACGKRHGLIVSLTRFVHFGPLPAELEAKHRAVVEVDAALIANTVEGAEVKDIFGKALAAYKRVGHPDEWKLHHQGGPTGYQGRSYKGTPDVQGKVLNNQAFAWNPSITGTKSEDTIIASGDRQETISAARDWPMIGVDVKGRKVLRPGILVI